jgi:hypothetical protein
MENPASGKNTVDLSGKLTDISTMSGIDSLLKVARRYAKIEGIPLSTVSSRALNDGKKLAALEAGADINVKRLERAMLWFSDNWPAGEWPASVDRPVAEKVRA